MMKFGERSIYSGADRVNGEVIHQYFTVLTNTTGMKYSCSLKFWSVVQIVVSTHPHPHPTLGPAFQNKFTLSLLTKAISGISLLLEKSKACLA